MANISPKNQGASLERYSGKTTLKVSALAFDFDGTIVDSVDYLVGMWLQIAKRVGIEPEVDVELLIGLTGTEIIRTLAGGDESKMRRIRDELTEAASTERFVRNVKLFPDIIPALLELRRRGYRTALASSTRSDRLKERALGLGVGRLFDIIVGGEEVTESKPAPDLIVEAANRLGVAVGKMAYVGDTRHDVKAAIQAGAVSILVRRQSPEYSGPQPDLAVNDLAELLSYL